jgi:hypothetical protein
MTHTHFFGTLVGLRAIRPWVVIAFCAAVLVSACAPSAVRHNRHGNVHFADGAYADAIEAYRLAQIADSEKAEPFYNAANAYNRNAQLSATLAQTQQALRTANACPTMDRSHRCLPVSITHRPSRPRREAQSRVGSPAGRASPGWLRCRQQQSGQQNRVGSHSATRSGFFAGVAGRAQSANAAH